MKTKMQSWWVMVKDTAGKEWNLTLPASMQMLEDGTLEQFEQLLKAIVAQNSEVK